MKFLILPTPCPACAAAILLLSAPFTGFANPPDPTGDQNFGMETRAGSGGRVIRVTHVNASGPGSFAEALREKGPRIVVFEAGGVIDLQGRVLTISEPFLTVAGQTAPHPGITLVRGGINIATHDVLLQHIRVRAGDRGKAKKSGWEVDAMATNGAWNVVVDHCSLAWATDENLSASGERFGGKDPSEWRQHTSHDITFRRCIIAEGLNQSTHAKGAHSKGSLIHDNACRIAIVGNLYASNADRNPLFKGGTEGVAVNNFIYNPGSHAVRYRLVASEWKNHNFLPGRLAVVGNVLQHGPDTGSTVPLLSYDGDGPLEVFMEDNQAWDRSGKPVAIVGGRKGSQDAGFKRLEAPPLWPVGLKAEPATQVRESVMRDAGARPWDRDALDLRILREITGGGGRIIDSQDEAGGYPAPAPTERKLDLPGQGIEEWLQRAGPGW